MSPGAGIHDDPVRPVERVVAPVDVFAFVIRLPATDMAAERGSPLVDAGLELRKGHTAVERRVASCQDVEVRSVQDDDLHRATLRGDQLVEGAAHVVRRNGDVPVRTVFAEKHEPSLLVTAERGPRTVAVDANRPRIEHRDSRPWVYLRRLHMDRAGAGAREPVSSDHPRFARPREE